MAIDRAPEKTLGAKACQPFSPNRASAASRETASRVVIDNHVKKTIHAAQPFYRDFSSRASFLPLGTNENALRMKVRA